MVSFKQSLKKLSLLASKHYGPLHWWPGESPFEVMVGAILTQNTAWANVEKAIGNLKKNKQLSFASMLVLDPEQLSKIIRPAGYFNIKTKRLKAFLVFLDQEYDGDLRRMKQEATMPLREKLLSVYGIGKETADSILLYALERPIFVVDTYTHRIFKRHAWIDFEADYDAIAQKVMRDFPDDTVFFNELHAQIVMIGKDFCRPKPRCAACPLKCLESQFQYPNVY